MLEGKKKLKDRKCNFMDRDLEVMILQTVG